LRAACAAGARSAPRATVRRISRRRRARMRPVAPPSHRGLGRARDRVRAGGERGARHARVRSPARSPAAVQVPGR
jgi:hypothetical protein